MEYRIQATGEVVQDHDFYAMHPNVSGIHELTCGEFGADPVYPSDPPVPGRYEKLVRDGAKLVEGVWRAKYAVVKMGAEEVAHVDRDLKTQVFASAQALLDQEAKDHGYGSMLSLCSYATSTNARFAAEGQYGVNRRDQVWAVLHAMDADVQAGTRTMPDWATVLGELPAAAWPELE
jgi:hypothetical protein